MAVAAEATEAPASVPTPPPSSGEPRRPTPPPLPPRPEVSPAATAPAPATATRPARARSLVIPPWRGARRSNSAAAAERPRRTVADRTDTGTSSPATTATTPEAARPSPTSSTEMRPTLEEPRGMESRTAWVRTHMIPSWAGGSRDNSSAAATATAVNRPDRATTQPPTTTAPEEARPSPVSTAVDARPTFEEPRARESRVARVRAYVIPPWAGGPRDNTSTAATAATSTAALAAEANRAGAATPPPTTTTAPEAARPSPVSATADARPTLEEPRARESRAARVRAYVIPPWAGGSRDNSSAAATATPATPTTPTAAAVNRTDAATPPAPTTAPEAARPSPISTTADARPNLGEPRAIEARTTRVRNYVIPSWTGASRNNSSATTAATAAATSASATPAEATTVEATPAEATQAEATPAEATTAEATPAEATPAEATPAEATPVATAVVTAAAPARAPERELTPAEAQAIMDAADMAAAEEVVAANEAADAFAVAQAIAASESSGAPPEAESDPAGRRAGDGEGGRMSLALHHRVRLARERAPSSSSDLVGGPATMDAAGTRLDSGSRSDGDLVRGGRGSQTRQGLRRFASSPGQQQATGRVSDAETELDSASLTDLDEANVVLVPQDRAALPRERGPATINRNAAGTRLDSGSRSDGDMVREGRVLRARQVLRRFASSPGQQQATGRVSDAEAELDSAFLADLDEGNVVLVRQDRAALPRERGPATINRGAAGTRLDSGSRSDGDLVRGGRLLRTRQVLRRFASSPGQQQATGRVSDAETELDSASLTDLDEGNVVLVQQDRVALPRERGPATINRDAAGTRLDSGSRSDGDLVQEGRVLRARQVLRRFASSPGQQQATGQVSDAETELDSALLTALDEGNVVLVQQDRAALPRERGPATINRDAAGTRLDSGSRSDGDLVQEGRVLRARQVLRRFTSSPGQQQATGQVSDAETELDSALLTDLDERYVVLQQDRVALPREREASMSSEQATSRRPSDDPEMELDSGSQTDEGGDGDGGRASLAQERARLPRGRTMRRSRDPARGRAQDDASSTAVAVAATERTRRTQSSPPVLERPPPSPPARVQESGVASDAAASGSDAEEQTSPTTTQAAATQTGMEEKEEEEAPESSLAAAVADAQPETTEGGEEEALESPTAAQADETQPEEEGKTAVEVEEEEEEEAEADAAGGVALGGSGGTVFPIVREDPDSGAAAFRCDSCAECQSLIVDASAHRDAVGMKGKVSAGLNSDRCRNCWRVVCDSCIGTCWARTMVPKMYTRDSDSHRMRVCKTCHCAMEMFRKSLLLGRVEEAMAAYGTGCVNLDTPYTIYHGELPVHCAAAGGNVVLLSWLVDELGCSLFVDEDLKKPLRDLRNLTVLGAAAVNAQVQTMRYLVNTKRCSLFEITHLPTMKKALEACLHVSPEAKFSLGARGSGPSGQQSNEIRTDISLRAVNNDGERSSYVDRGGAIVVPAVFGAASSFHDEDDCCIVCFDNEVACTLVPCGHHCCCRDCAGRLTYCPVCRARITEMIKAIPV